MVECYLPLQKNNIGVPTAQKKIDSLILRITVGSIMSALERAWSVLKAENTAEQKSAIIECLKKEGGAASLEDCCKAAKMSKEDCKSLINTMDNVKIHDSGDVVLMDGL